MCSLDYEQCAVWNERTRVARKAHECDGCGATIVPKEPYCYVSGVSYGSGWSERLCFACWWDWERFGESHGIKPNPSEFRDALRECVTSLDDVSEEPLLGWRPALAALLRRYRTSLRGRLALANRWAS